jgi:hypothetical protein
MDFMSGVLAFGKLFPTFNMLDDVNREVLHV